MKGKRARSAAKRKETEQKLEQRQKIQETGNQLPACFVTDFDQYLIGQGNHYDIFRKLGAHPTVFQGEQGVYFAVWAPHAVAVHVIGEFNGWNETSHPMKRLEPLGIWKLFGPGVQPGCLYKYLIEARDHRLYREAGDPLPR